jgi:hypothetical protein
MFSHNIQQRPIYFLDKYVIIIFVTKFQNHGSEHNHGLLWIKDAPIHGINTNEKIIFFLSINTFHIMYPITNYITKCTITSTHLDI